jgi:ring-1,2-phenylacetyl-CoA epoxidase subunit PaaD
LEAILRTTPFILTLEKMNDKLNQILSSVPDPEVPVLSILDLGIVREVHEQGTMVEVVITPTYTGCPAMDTIATQIRMELLAHGYTDVRIRTVLSPAWTTDWMSEAGKEKLKAYGIAPPLPVQQACRQDLFGEQSVPCPHCGSHHTQKLSEFGSTACKSLYRCEDCLEPFDYFKCH